MKNDAQQPPLTPAVFHILLALSTEERHGYAIMKQVEADSLGKVKMGPGTLYGSIKRMLDSGLIEESETRVDPEMDDARRIYYRISASGELALKDELQRYSHLVKLTRKLGLAFEGSYVG
ncbi:MAG: PadR family transcriptional regulator [Pyrinomonadaceae bacterium]